MKKLTALFLSLVMVMSLAACGGNAASTPASDSSAGQPAPSQSTAPDADASGSASTPDSSAATSAEAQDAPEEGQTGGTLVVYFSAQGHTEQVANYIAATTGGDLFELEPVDPYSDEDLNYTDDSSRVSQEYVDESLRDVELVADTVENWDSYDTIFIGYPIWWGIAAWPVNGFVEANDFTGKTVIPFCTSASSGLGESGTLLAELAGTGDWQEGMRFRSSPSEEDVQSWVNGLGL